MRENTLTTCRQSVCKIGGADGVRQAQICLVFQLSGNCLHGVANGKGMMALYK